METVKHNKLLLQEAIIYWSVTIIVFIFIPAEKFRFFFDEVAFREKCAFGLKNTRFDSVIERGFMEVNM